MGARVYLDEDVHQAVALGLRHRGHDILTTSEAGRLGRPDADQLSFATTEDRCLFSFNRGDFAALHGQTLAAGGHHAGIIVAPQAPPGAVVRALALLFSRHGTGALRDQLVWLKL